jgi:hypothetical protein
MASESSIMPAISRSVPAQTPPSAIRFTIATLVTDAALHAEMLRSFADGGFDGPDCEFLHVDNSVPSGGSAYRELNRLLAAARGEIVILCHQDVRLIADGRATLEARLAELDRHDPSWGVAGNAGGVAPGRLAIRISDGHAADQRIGSFPQRVASLDENLLIVRAAARLGFSDDLDGYHFYGTDLCLQAEMRGYRAYVVDFHLLHLSKGNKSASFQACEAQLRRKWHRALRPRWIQTTCSLVYLTNSALGHRLGGWTAGVAAKLARRLPGAAGWVARPAPLLAASASPRSRGA